MKVIHKLATVLVLFGACLPLAAQTVDASRDVLKILVGFPPGGATDNVARIMADKLRPLLNQNVVVENKPGAGGLIATQLLKSAPADGNTVMLTIDHSHVIIPLTFKSPGYNPATDFTPLAGVATYYNVMAVSSAAQVGSMKDLGQWLKANPGKANYGIPAPGSVPQFAGLLVGQSLGAPMVAVPYKGGAPLVQDLLGNQVSVGFLSLSETIQHHTSGKMKVLAVSGTTRAQTAPDIPTFTELGIKGMEINPWLGFFGPKGMSADSVNRFSQAVATVLRDQEVADKLTKMGNVPTYASPSQLQQWVTSGTTAWGPVIKSSGFELQ